MTKLGIVGTAFRGVNTDFDSILTKELYFDKIYPKAVEVVKELNVNTIISGGAAGIDHLAPLLWDNNIVTNLSLYYPTKFNDISSLISRSLIRYHYNFSSICFDNYKASLTMLTTFFSHRDVNNIVFNEEPISTKYEGFFSRNKKIADNSDYLLVFSYFDNGKCLTSGTNSTIQYFLKNNSEDKIIKVDIREL